MSEHLQPEEFYKVFDLIQENSNPDINELRSLLITPVRVKPHRSTVSRLIGIISRVMDQGSDSLTDEKAERIAGNVGYGATASLVKRIYDHYINWLTLRTSKEILNEKLKIHMNKLALTAEELADSLKPYWPYTWPTDQTIAEVAVENDDRALVSILKSPEAEWLFAHMKEELPQLENINNWKDLKVNNITEDLVHRLSLRAAQKEFLGKCEVCQD